MFTFFQIQASPSNRRRHDERTILPTDPQLHDPRLRPAHARRAQGNPLPAAPRDGGHDGLAAGNGDRSENSDYHYAKKKLRQYDGRIRFLSQRLEQTIIVDPVEQGNIANGRVLFGATVRVATEEGEEKVYSIVGVDELDPGRGYVSWVSPIGRALLGKSGNSQDQPGTLVTFVT